MNESRIVDRQRMFDHDLNSFSILSLLAGFLVRDFEEMVRGDGTLSGYEQGAMADMWRSAHEAAMREPCVPGLPRSAVDEELATDSAAFWAVFRAIESGDGSAATGELETAAMRLFDLGLIALAARQKAHVRGRRLVIDLARLVATLDGTSYDVKSERALRWIAILADRPGEWISSVELANHDQELQIVRTDHLKKFLPNPILELIDSETGKGSRIRL